MERRRRVGCRLLARSDDEVTPEAKFSWRPGAGVRSASEMGDAAGAVSAQEKAISLLPPAVPGAPLNRMRLNMETALKGYRAKIR